MNWVTVDPGTGTLYAVYYDTRNFPANDSAQLYESVSMDGGDTLQHILVSDGAGSVDENWDAGPNEHVGGGVFFGAWLRSRITRTVTPFLCARTSASAIGLYVNE